MSTKIASFNVNVIGLDGLKKRVAKIQDLTDQLNAEIESLKSEDVTIDLSHSVS